jgi:hypothetical protein
MEVERSLSVVVAVVGLLLFVGGLGLLEVDTSPDPEYVHTVDSVDGEPFDALYGVESDTERQAVFAFRNLSQRGQAVFENTLAAERNGSEYRLDDDATLPDEFVYYTDTLQTGAGVYFVNYSGDYYELNTRKTQTFQLLSIVVGLPVAILGAVVLLFGIGLLLFRNPPSE